jgi:4-alpha-glucanotransferase
LQVLGGEGRAPASCTPAVLEHILQQHMDSPSMLAIFPLQDLLPLSSRLPDVPAALQQVNEPSNPEHYWRYRLHVSLEQIQEDADLRHLLTDMLQAAQRFHGDAPRTG